MPTARIRWKGISLSRCLKTLQAGQGPFLGIFGQYSLVVQAGAQAHHIPNSVHHLEVSIILLAGNNHVEAVGTEVHSSDVFILVFSGFHAYLGRNYNRAGYWNLR